MENLNASNMVRVPVRADKRSYSSIPSKYRREISENSASIIIRNVAIDHEFTAIGTLDQGHAALANVDEVYGCAHALPSSEVSIGASVVVLEPPRVKPGGWQRQAPND